VCVYTWSADLCYLQHILRVLLQKSLKPCGFSRKKRADCLMILHFTKAS